MIAPPPLGTAGEEARADLLHPELLPLFNDHFVRSHLLFEEYVVRLAIQVARDTGLEAALTEPGTAAEIVARARLDTLVAPAPVDWILRQLAARSLIQQSGDPAQGATFVCAAPLPAMDPDEPVAEQQQHDPSALAAYRIAALAAARYPAFLSGAVQGEEILFSPQQLAAWFEYFSNGNPLYAINNAVGAVAADLWLPAPAGEILELGAGLGSGAVALLHRLQRAGRLDEVSGYRFTDISPHFLRRGRRAVSQELPDLGGVTYSLLDMDHPFAEQGVEPGQYSMVYGVNTLHVARDLELTLAEIRRALAPGGLLLLSECVRPSPHQPVPVEFVFNLLEAFRAPLLHAPWRPNGGFLTPEQWHHGLAAYGFEDVRLLPDVTRVRDTYPSFFVAAVGATRR